MKGRVFARFIKNDGVSITWTSLLAPHTAEAALSPPNPSRNDDFGVHLILLRALNIKPRRVEKSEKWRLYASVAGWLGSNNKLY